jgi:hypothetical protein
MPGQLAAALQRTAVYLVYRCGQAVAYNGGFGGKRAGDIQIRLPVADAFVYRGCGMPD